MYTIDQGSSVGGLWFGDNPQYLVSLFHQGSLRTILKPVLNLEPILHVTTAKELALSQEKWFENSTNILLV